MLNVGIEDLARSGITAEEAEHGEMFSSKDASEWHEDFRPVPALIIPYIDPWTGEFYTYKLDGEEHHFMRVRYLDKPPKTTGFKKKKQIRYSQPKDSGMFVYFPTAPGIDWPKILKDPATPIMITEGEKKALVACLEGIPTIGIGGVYNFAKNEVLLEVLENIEWEDREVYLCYDSDAATNGRIQVAEARFAKELGLVRSAVVRLVRLPEAKDGSKVGIDDYLLEHDVDDLIDLMHKAKDMRPVDKEVIKLNDDICWIEEEGIVLDTGTNTVIKKENLKSGSKYASREVWGLNAKGKPVAVSVATEWLKHPHRRGYDSILFRPDTVDETVDTPTGGIAYNRFRGLSGSPGDVAPFLKLLKYLMTETPEVGWEFVIKLLAWKIQNLGKRPKLGLMMVGTQGGGKTLFTDSIRGMFGIYGVELQAKDLGGEFNPWTECALCVVLNEVKTSDLQINTDALKGLVTDERKGCNEKYRPAKQVTNYGMYLFNSNDRSAGAFSGDDRRMIIVKVPDTHPDGEEFYEEVFEWYEDGGSEHLAYYLMNYDLEGWSPPNKAPGSHEKAAVHDLSMTPVQSIAKDIKGSTGSIVYTWIKSTLDRAKMVADGTISSTAQDMAGAEVILATFPKMGVRDIYTADELSKMFSDRLDEYSGGARRRMTANQFGLDLLQEGIPYAKCSEPGRQFRWKGRYTTFLVVCDPEDWRDEMSQEEFDDYMNAVPSYIKLRQDIKDRAKKAARKSKRKKRT